MQNPRLTPISAKDNSDHNSARCRHFFFFARVFVSQHGGSLVGQAMVQMLLDDGHAVTILTEDPGNMPQFGNASQIRVVRLSSFFRRGIIDALTKAREIITVCRLVTFGRSATILVQGDLPRVTYIILQLFVPLFFFRSDGILTCPANNRYLPRRKAPCKKTIGFSCLAVHKEEGCMGRLSLAKRVGRICFRIRDLCMLKMIRRFVANSEYIGGVHERPASILYPPQLGSIVQLSRQRDLCRIVFCARLEFVKGGVEAIKVLSLLPSVYTLEVLGEGASSEEMEKVAYELGVRERITFHGWVDRHDRDKVLASAGVMLMTSLCDEAFGMVGVEAFLQGTPVVAYDVGGVSEWCRSPAGILVSCGDVSAAAEAIIAITAEEAAWSKASESALGVSENFSMERFKRSFRDLLADDHDLTLRHRVTSSRA